MEIALIEALKEYFIWYYAIFIIVCTEVWKRCSIKDENNNKWYLKFDKEKHLGFNLRVLTIAISVIVGIILSIIDNENNNVFELLITFGLTTVFYEYIYKTIIKTLELNNYSRQA